jgi:DNA-binding transcriptional ArsR family regulator
LTVGCPILIVNLMVQYKNAGRSRGEGRLGRSRQMDGVLAAVSDPTRRAILARLAEGPARISDVAAPFPMTLTGFCKHVRVLERAGLVRCTRQGREKRLEVMAEPLREVAQWAFGFERFWTMRMDRLEEFFKAKQAGSVAVHKQASTAQEQVNSEQKK